MHEIVVQIREKHEANNKQKAGELFITGWVYLDKTQKKRVLDEMMKDLEVKV